MAVTTPFASTAAAVSGDGGEHFHVDAHGAILAPLGPRLLGRLLGFAARFGWRPHGDQSLSPPLSLVPWPR